MGIRKSSLVAPASALTAVALWGLAFPLIQDGLMFFSPVMLGFVRFVLGTVAFLAVILVRYPLERVVSTAMREWRPLLVLGLLYVTIPNIAQNIGLQEGTSSVASVIQSSGPVMTLAFAVVFLREPMTGLKALGTVIALGGTLLLVAGNGFSIQDEGFVSNLLILISAVSYGAAWVSAKRMLERNPPILIIGLSLAIGTVILGLAVPFENPSEATITPDSMANILVLGIFCAGASSALYLTSLERHEVSRIAFLVYLMPVFASAFAWALRGEGVEAWTIVCGAVIVVGIIVANKDEFWNSRSR